MTDGVTRWWTAVSVCFLRMPDNLCYLSICWFWNILGNKQFPSFKIYFRRIQSSKCGSQSHGTFTIRRNHWRLSNTPTEGTVQNSFKTAQGCIQFVFEFLWRRRLLFSLSLHTVSSLVQVCGQPLCKNSVFFEWKFLSEFTDVILCPFSVHHCEKPG